MSQVFDNSLWVSVVSVVSVGLVGLEDHQGTVFKLGVQARGPPKGVDIRFWMLKMVKVHVESTGGDVMVLL